MRPSRVLAKLRKGEMVVCAGMNLGSPRAVEIAARCGYDCVWLGMEHVPNTLHDIEEQIRAAKMYDVDSIVRVPRGSYSDFIRPLELDASGIMVPHVMSAADAREIVRRVRFYPLGRRPIDGGNADAAYGMIPVADYIKQANEQRFVSIQIEDPEPIDELDEIAAVEGIDILFFGPVDFSHGIGKPDQLDHPEVVEAMRLVAQAAQKHGKFAGTPAGVIDIEEQIGMGYQFLLFGADVVGLSQYFRDMLEQIHQIGKQV